MTSWHVSSHRCSIGFRSDDLEADQWMNILSSMKIIKSLCSVFGLILTSVKTKFVPEVSLKWLTWWSRTKLLYRFAVTVPTYRSKNTASIHTAIDIYIGQNNRVMSSLLRSLDTVQKLILAYSSSRDKESQVNIPLTYGKCNIFVVIRVSFLERHYIAQQNITARRVDCTPRSLSIYPTENVCTALERAAELLQSLFRTLLVLTTWGRLRKLSL